jgi:FtsP/CotA-like multicopper oxidase with cupredoxin domain
MPRQRLAVRVLSLGLALAAAFSAAACAGKEAPEAAQTSRSGTSTSSSPPSTTAPSSTPAESSATSSPTGAPGNGTQISISLTGGEASGQVGGRVSVGLGDPVTITVTSDTPDEIHVHGYDLTAPIGPGTSGTLTFDATIPGVFEVELHESGRLLVSLQVG